MEIDEARRRCTSIAHMSSISVPELRDIGLMKVLTGS